MVTININTPFHGLLEFIFNKLDAAVVLADSNRKIAYANAAALELFDVKNSDFIGKSTKSFYANEDDFGKKGDEVFNERATYSDDAYIVEYKRTSGEVFKGETIGCALREPSSGNIFYLGMIKDISYRLSAEDALHQLQWVTSSRDLSFDERIDSILEIGCNHFGLPIGIFSHIENNVYIIMHARHPENALSSGMEFQLGETYCSHVYSANDVKGFHHVGESEINTHPCYLNFGLEAYLGCPIFVDGERYGTINFSSPIATRKFREQDKELIRQFAEWIGHEIARNNDLRKLEAANKKLELLATRDTLTGVYNRLYTEEFINKELERSKRYGRALTIAMMDLDNFKKLNDTYGHLAGDEALKVFSTIATSQIRANDIFARWGGEEFIAIFPECTLPKATTILERIRENLSSSTFQFEGKTISFTVSIGVSSTEGAKTMDQLLLEADSALYKAKKNGKNSVIFKLS